ncbi:MAG TPA: FG-GAP-like repeat-containing protein, partial [Candidatus Acidoferrales bacterium]|nr:FG-GAP-like repeat-containing protein [Candidatus Acidoferrales bacterium]
MSRKSFGALSLFTVALVVPAISWAQISFVPGIARKVPTGPNFIAADDFNNDNIKDAVVSSTVRDTVTVLFGSPDANFAGSVVEIPTGRLLRDITTGDFNGDRIPDIAVADNYAGGVFIINAITGASFSSPQFFAGQARGPYDVVPGHFDVGTTLDLAVANRTRDTFTVFTNDGGTRGLRNVGSFPTGNGPRSILSADLNGDHFDDVILLDTGARGTDEVSIYLNQGNGTFQGIVPQRFVVGVGAVAMTTGDFNGDGKLDIAVVNGSGAGVNNFTLSILLGDVNPIFSVLPPVIFGCPSQLNGIQVVCTPQDIKAADFDGDTRTDLAISFSTRATNTQQSTSGFVNAYSGRGNGSFDFGTQIIVGLGPRRIVAADVTGDGVPDVVVTAFTDSTVQVLRSRTPDRKDLGGSCVVGRQCISNACVDGVCCDTASCPSGQRCDVFPNPGTCKVPAPDGTECTENEQCATQACTDGYCCTRLSCPAGQYCNTGMCAPPASNGTQCNANEQCSSGFCTDGVC